MQSQTRNDEVREEMGGLFREGMPRPGLGPCSSSLAALVLHLQVANVKPKESLKDQDSDSGEDSRDELPWKKNQGRDLCVEVEEGERLAVVADA